LAPLELYDLAYDPGKTKNIAKIYPEIVDPAQGVSRLANDRE